jgi:hypothetical protein
MRSFQSLFLYLMLVDSLLSIVYGGGWKPRRSRTLSRSTFQNEQTYGSKALNARGGTTTTPSLQSSSSNSPSSVSSISAVAADLAVSVWVVSRHLVSKHVVPAVLDPHDRLVVPMRRIFQASKTEASIRKSPPQAASVSEQEETIISEPSTAKQEDTTPTNSLRRKSTKPSFRQKSSNQVEGTTTAAAILSPLSFVLSPGRLVKLPVLAWMLAETLDRLDILHEQTPAVLRSQFHRVWYDVQPRLFQWQHQLQALWQRITPESIQSIPTKYQFAMGASLGMIASPLVASLSVSLWQPALVLYGLAELNSHIKAKGGKWNLPTLLGDGEDALGIKLDSWLDGVRQWVRNRFPEPPNSPTSLLETSGGSKDPGYSLGITGYCPTESSTKRQLLQLQLKNLGNKVVDSSKHSLLEMRGIMDHESITQDHTIVEMIRHGFLVGGLLGLVAGV